MPPNGGQEGLSRCAGAGVIAERASGSALELRTAVGVNGGANFAASKAIQEWLARNNDPTTASESLFCGVELSEIVRVIRFGVSTRVWHCPTKVLKTHQSS